MVGKIKCSVPCCTNIDKKSHRFPNPKNNPANFTRWKCILKVKNLTDEKIYSNLRICCAHFEQSCYSVGTSRLNRDALPTLHIPEIIEKDGENLPANAQHPFSPKFIDTPNQEVLKSLQVQHQDESHVPVQYLNKNMNSNLPEIIEFVDENVLQLVSNQGRQLNPQTASSVPMEKKLRREMKLKNENKIKLAKLKKMLHTKQYKDMSEKLTPTVVSFITSQIKCASKKKRGMRYTLDNKILGITLMKNIPRTYRLLHQIFNLPSRSTLNNLLANITIRPGFDQSIFDYLKEIVKTLKPSHKYCSLIFDEVSLSAHLDYNSPDDKIYGFQNIGGAETSSQFADHAIVFMLRGVVKKWKQVVLFNFTKSTCSPIKIKTTIVRIVTAAQKAGLHVVSTVCDGGAINVAAIKQLKAESKSRSEKAGKEFRSCGFEINGEIINPIMDPCHLIKLMRNHFMKNNLMFEENNEKKIAKWEHILNFFEIDCGVTGVRMTKLTEEHVIPNKIKKMKVSHAVQVLSASVGNLMTYTIGICRRLNPSANILGESADDTASVIRFLDRLFDSMNGSISKPPNGKELRGPFCETQLEFWQEAKQILNSMCFVKGEKTFKPPCVKSFVKNIDNFSEITERLKSNGIKYIYLRNFNKDPLENFFGSISSLNFPNVNPKTTQFQSIYEELSKL